MQLNSVIEKIEKFAPLESQESWDCSGWIVQTQNLEANKVLLCLSVNENIIEQALVNDCDLIISHHPLFFVPVKFNHINIYSAHTNLDKAVGGTTDSLISLLGFDFVKAQKIGDFLRLIELQDEMLLGDLILRAKNKLEIKNLRIVNNNSDSLVKKIAFCAGSGADFISLAEASGADILITGDVKYHNALDSNIIIFDVGHFESEIPVLESVKKLLTSLQIEVMIADEKSPFIYY